MTGSKPQNAACAGCTIRRKGSQDGFKAHTRRYIDRYAAGLLARSPQLAATSCACLWGGHAHALQPLAMAAALTKTLSTDSNQQGRIIIATLPTGFGRLPRAQASHTVCKTSWGAQAACSMLVVRLKYEQTGPENNLKQKHVLG